MKTAVTTLRNKSLPKAIAGPRVRGRTASVILEVRSSRTHFLITRWHRMKMAQHGFGPVEKLLRDSVDPLTKPISELENYSSQMFEGLVLIGTFCIEGHRLWAFIGKLANKYRDVPLQ
ncbi:hypothetical protein PF007_g12294 [Phytophthora fragariae]|nr:hypothetical protein PF003_g28304 [Phytophthora fragariae]KAE9109284.1 hypothetical protein PF007_g12294 [Phytophthora fragariae]KAE9228375.1 hypothetical protein PF004_g11077 [Phytophthora fragariae]